MSEQDHRFLTRQILWLAWHKRQFLLDFSDHLWPQFFGSPEARYLYKVAQEHFGAYGKAPTRAVLNTRLDADEDTEKLDREGVTAKGVRRLYERLEPVDADDFEYLWQEAEEFCRRQRTSFALREALEALDEDGVDSVFEIINKAKAAIQRPEALTAELITGTNEALARIGIRESTDAYFSTGLPRIDAKMGGGLKTGELACFIAPTGRGKSMWLCHLAYFALIQGVDVVYYTFEVDRDEVWMRIMASATGIAIDTMKEWAASGTRDPEARARHDEDPAQLIAKFRTRCLREGVRGKDVLIRDIPPRAASVDGIIADIEDIRSRGRDPKLIIVDYADRMQARGRFDKQWEGQPQVYQDLVSLAKSEDLAIWTAAQGDRGSLDRTKLTLKNIQGAFAKAFEASFVIAAGQDTTMREHNYASFYMAKARRSKGSDTISEVWYDFATSRFVDAIKPIDAEEDTSLAMTKVIDYEEDEPPEAGKFG